LLRLNKTIITIIFAIKISENNLDKQLNDYNKKIMKEHRALLGMFIVEKFQAFL